MKALILLFTLFFSASAIQAQEVIMKIRMKNGSELRINTDSVKLMSATPLSYPKFRMMKIGFQIEQIEGGHLYDSTWMDSLHFVKESGIVSLMLRYNSGYSIAPKAFIKNVVDTITFGQYTYNTSVQKLIGPHTDHWPEQLSSAWHDSTIYATMPVQKYVLNADFAIVRDSLFEWDGPLTFEINDAGDRLAFPGDGNNGMWIGRLVEHDLKTGTFTTLTTDSMITGIRYLSNSNDLIYYTLGSFDHDSMPNPQDAGYYLLNRSTGETTFLLKVQPSPWYDEPVSGFDISHDGRKLLFSRSLDPSDVLMMELDLETQEVDTLKVSFPNGQWTTLWMQYSNDDSRILYSLSDFKLIPSPVGIMCEVGILDRATVTKQILDVEPHDMMSFCTPFPRWSPDNTAICYGSAMGRVYIDSVDPFYLYVKKL